MNHFLKKLVFTGNGLVILLTVLIFLLGFKISREIKNSFFTFLITIGLMLFGYFLFYVITPKPLEWHLNTSLNRLFFQLVPSIIFTVFLGLKNINSTIKDKNGQRK